MVPSARVESSGLVEASAKVINSTTLNLKLKHYKCLISMISTHSAAMLDLTYNLI
jgi:hypothetical protein